jgi:ABC-2 type transport system ATP-binding protein
VLAGAGFKVRDGGGAIVMQDACAVDSPEAVATLLVNAGTPPTRLAVEQEDLEEYFLRLIGEKE